MDRVTTELLATGFPKSWLAALQKAKVEQVLLDVVARVRNEREAGITIFPQQDDLFNALKTLSPECVRVVILGQDPYHQPGQAHGFAFSVPKGIKTPPSLVNMYKSIQLHEPDYQIPTHGCLLPWAEQGVLLLNTVLSVREGQAGSHQSLGWQAITQAILAHLAETSRCIFVLWGKHAQAAVQHIPLEGHVVFRGVHPSPLSAYRGFFEQKDFYRINQVLQETGEPPIDWKLA